MYKKQTLKNTTLFADFSDEELVLIASIAEKKTYNAGEIVYSEDKGGSSLFIIVKGMVRISKVVRFGERQTLTRLKPREFFGEMSFLDNHQHSATAEAVEATEVIEIHRSNFEKLIDKNPLLAYKIMTRLALQLSTLLRKMDERFVEMVNYMWGKGKI